MEIDCLKLSHILASYQSGRMMTLVGALMVMAGCAGAGLWLMVAKPKAGTPPGNVWAGRVLGILLILLAGYVGFQLWR